MAIQVGKCATLAENEASSVVTNALAILRNIFQDKVTTLLNSHLTKWDKDEFSFGSFSYLKVHSSPDDYDSLSIPIHQKLFFAGEATNRHHPATIAGAMLSGTREAGRIAQYYSPLPKALEIQMKYELVYYHVCNMKLRYLNSRTTPYSRSRNQNDHNQQHQINNQAQNSRTQIIDNHTHTHHQNNNNNNNNNNVNSSDCTKLLELACFVSPNLDDITQVLDIHMKGNPESIHRPAMAPTPITSSNNNHHHHHLNKNNNTFLNGSLQIPKEMQLPPNWNEKPIAQHLISKLSFSFYLIFLL